MQFKHPEILYALFLLVIPIIVHLFQLRRFQKVPFTNIKFLKEVELQTRKSSRLKKFLVLLSRLLLFASLIVAFAQPFLSNSEKSMPVSNYIYLDNSYSMQAQGEEGELLKRAAQDIIEAAPSLGRVNIFTNNENFEELSPDAVKNTLLSIDYYPIKKDLSSVLFQLENKIPKNGTLSNIFLISDFQQINISEDIILDSVNNYYITQLIPKQKSNISIDSIYIKSQNKDQISFISLIKKYGSLDTDSSVSLFNGDMLAGRSPVIFNENSVAEVEFTIPNSDNFSGKLELEDTSLPFDNTLFFTVDKPKKINVTALGNDNEFLSKIYTDDEFNFISTPVDRFNYNTIDEQHLLILNELEIIPATLLRGLLSFMNNGGSIVIIPAINADLNSYKTVFDSLGLGTIFNNATTDDLAITTIHFSHPFLRGVFEKEIENFQYPSVKKRYQSVLRNTSSILSFENNQSFISQAKRQNGTIYWLAAPISTDNSNFRNSPLIVPVFYNFGLYSFKASDLYYTIGNTNSIEIHEELKKDKVLHLVNATEDFIPLQQITAQKVTLTTTDKPEKSGYTEVRHNEITLKNIAFNYDRKESDIANEDLEPHFDKDQNINIINSVSGAFKALEDTYKVTPLWHYFLLLALLFLITEMLLLKYFKS